MKKHVFNHEKSAFCDTKILCFSHLLTLKSCVSPIYLEVDLTSVCPFPSETKEAGTDNRNIVDDGKSQKLTHDDIKALKDKGIKGQVKIK